MSLIYAVGDIHGRLDHLEHVLALIDTDAAALGIGRPRVVFLGDYVDRGPDSKGVLDLLTAGDFEKRYDPVFIAGNHDIAMLGVLEGGSHFDWLMFGGGECIDSYCGKGKGKGVNITEFCRAVPAAHRTFLETLRLAYEQDGNLFTHAGLNPFVEIGSQQAADLLNGHKAFLQWPRRMVAGRVVHGHWTSDSVIVTDRRVGLDTRCGFPGGWLSAAAIDDEKVRVLNPVEPLDQEIAPS